MSVAAQRRRKIHGDNYPRAIPGQQRKRLVKIRVVSMRCNHCRQGRVHKRWRSRNGPQETRCCTVDLAQSRPNAAALVKTRLWALRRQKYVASCENQMFGCKAADVSATRCLFAGARDASSVNMSSCTFEQRITKQGNNRCVTRTKNCDVDPWSRTSALTLLSS